MKITQERNNVTTCGVSNISQFQATMNAKAFKVMSDGLYKNKIGSIVREVACNAKDAHTQANKKDVPFTIHLPNIYEPYFSVEDEGVGLSGDQIVQVFCTLFESTKENSNDEVGAFGLGSKTPFAYTNAFTVTSIFDGTIIHYSMFMNDEDIPCIAQMGDSEKTDKPNGVKVQIPVQKNDYHEFTIEVKEQLKFLKIKPVILNDCDFRWNELEKPSLTIGTVELLNGNHSRYSNPMTIIQGEVGYPLEFNFICEKVDRGNLETLELLRENGARLTFDIGKIGVIPSREGIEYNDHTIKNINNKLTKFRKELVSETKKKLDAIDGNWNRLEALNKSTILATLAKITEYKLPENAERVRGGKYVFNLHKSFTKTVQYETKRPDGTIRKGDILNRLYKLVRYYYTTHDGKHVGIDTKFTPDTIAPGMDGEHEIFIKDTGKLPLAKLKHHMEQNRLREVFVLAIGGDNVNALDVAFDVKTVSKFKAQLGGVKMHRISDMEAPARSTKSACPQNLGFFLTRDNMKKCWFDTGSVYKWERAKCSLDYLEPQIYITVERYKPTCDETTLVGLENLICCGLIKHDLYAFNAATSKKVAKIDGWIKLEDHIANLQPELEKAYQSCDEYLQLCTLKNAIRDYAITPAVVHELYPYRALADKGTDGRWYVNISKNIRSICQDRINNHSSIVKRIVSNSPHEIETFFEKNDNIRKEFHIRGIGTYQTIQEKMAECKKKYGLLPTTTLGYKYSPSMDEVEHIFEYMNCMGKRA